MYFEHVVVVSSLVRCKGNHLFLLLEQCATIRLS